MPAPCFIRATADFDRIFAARQSVRGNFWRLHFLPNSANFARLGVIVNKRHIRSAALRNRIRRVIREHFRQHCRDNLPPMDFLTQTVDKTPVADPLRARVDFHRLLFAAVRKNKKEARTTA